MLGAFRGEGNALGVPVLVKDVSGEGGPHCLALVIVEVFRGREHSPHGKPLVGPEDESG
jgi:hypothetical protein